MKPRSRTPALWILAHRRRPSSTADPVEAERRKAYAAMDPAERLAQALEIPVVGVEDLIVLKLMAGGPADLADVADLLGRVGPLPELDKRAAARGVLELLQRIRASTGL